jgi:hypothetical protein
MNGDEPFCDAAHAVDDHQALPRRVETWARYLEKGLPDRVQPRGCLI